MAKINNSMDERDVKGIDGMDSQDSTRKIGKARNSKGKRGSRGGNFRNFNKGANSKGRNGIEWYNKNEQLMRDVASFPFNRAVGLKMPSYNNKLTISSPRIAPGICVLHWAPSISTSNRNASGINMAAKKIYGKIRKTNSAASIYSPADVMMYTIAVGEMYAYIAWLRRVYGTVGQYNMFNRYTPRHLVEAMGVDFDDVQNNYAQFRARINLLTAKLRKTYFIPKDFSIIERWVWLSSNIYRDDDNDKAQYYMFNPVGFHKYDEYTSEQGGMLQFMSPWGKNDAIDPISVDTMISFGETLVGALIESEDINNISGDMERHFGSENGFTMSDLPEDYSVEAVKNDEVLLQMHNWKDIGYTWLTISRNNFYFDITQDVNTQNIIYDPVRKETAAEPYKMMNNVLLNSYEKDMTPEKVMVATRLTTTYEFNAETGEYHFDALGTEIPCYQSYYLMNENAGLYDKLKEIEIYTIYHLSANITNEQLRDIITNMSIIESFDWHPEILILITDNGVVRPFARYFDLDNYTFISSNELAQVHDCAVLSELNVK